MRTKQLTYFHEIIENRGTQRVKQSMLITVEYFIEDDTFEVQSVDVFENGRRICEISKLLDKAEGQPLSEMLNAINWREVYMSEKEQEVEHE